MPEDTQGITDTDLKTCAIIFNSLSIPMPRRFFRYKATEDIWELYDVPPAANRVLIATRHSSTGVWTEV